MSRLWRNIFRVFFLYLGAVIIGIWTGLRW